MLAKRLADAARSSQCRRAVDMSEDTLAGAIESGDAATLRAFLGGLPGRMVEPAIADAASPRLEIRLSALNLVAAELARGLAPQLARPLADAVHIVALAHVDDPQLLPGVAAEQAGTAAEALADALALAGEFEGVVALARKAPTYLRRRTNGYRETSLRIKGALALIELGRLQEAEQELDALEAEGPVVDDPNLKFARDRLRARLRPATDLAPWQSSNERVLTSYKETKKVEDEAIAAVAKQLGQSPLPRRDVGSKEQPASISDVVRDLISRSGPIVQFLGLKGSELWQWRGRYQKVIGILSDPDTAHNSECLPTHCKHSNRRKTGLKPTGIARTQGHPLVNTSLPKAIGLY